LIAEYLQNGNKARERGSSRKMGGKIDAQRIKRRFRNVIFRNNLIESLYNRHIENRKTMFILNLREVNAEFAKAIY
jgi:hypothetical protein